MLTNPHVARASRCRMSRRGPSRGEPGGSAPFDRTLGSQNGSKTCYLLIPRNTLEVKTVQLPVYSSKYQPASIATTPRHFIVSCLIIGLCRGRSIGNKVVQRNTGTDSSQIQDEASVGSWALYSQRSSAQMQLVGRSWAPGQSEVPCLIGPTTKGGRP